MAAPNLGAPVGASPRRRPPGLLGRGLRSDEALICGVVLASWTLALAAGLTDRGGALDHDALIGRPAATGPLPLLLFVLAWQVMTGAMMLPTSLPLIWLFARASRRQPRPHLALVAFLAAYAAVWTGFALLALLGDTAVHAVVERSAWLGDRPWLISGLALLGAGAFQFSPLKERCLRECRHPLSFLMHHYGRGVRAAWDLGIRHGLFCLGCCWALMLVMFAVGVGNLAWMAGLTGVMLVEKTARWGRRLVPAVGTALVTGGILVLLRGALSGQV
jgi:predicted metal-binding membrane protein